MDDLKSAIKVFKEEWDGLEEDVINSKCRYLSSSLNCSDEIIEKAYREVFGNNTSLPDFFYMSEIKFEVGQIIEHLKYAYFGVIVAVDKESQASSEWHEHMQCTAKGITRKQPWYHVLVHNSTHTTYVAQQNLRLSSKQTMINHPLIKALFNGYDNRKYIRNDVPWDSF